MSFRAVITGLKSGQSWGGRSQSATSLCLILLSCTLRIHAAPARPVFHTAAAARAWGEQKERAGQFELASQAYLREAAMREAQGDPQAAEVERRRAARLHTDLALAIPAPVAPISRLAKLEPAAGCYIGVLDEYSNGERGNADDFEQRVGRPVAVAFNYDTYGRPFPLNWARRQASRGRAVQIAWEPPDLSRVRDDDYLHSWARAAARCGTGVFLRFGGEMNGGWTSWGRDPLAYRRAFRLVHEVVTRFAPNVAMIWAPNAVPVNNLDAYYPGDDVVDWVGISLYIVRFYDDNLSRPAWQDHPATFIEPFYRKYAARKPLCLVECGVTRRSRVENADADLFAAARIQDLFDAVRVRFPRLKMVCWFDRNNLSGARPDRRLNDYSLPDGSLALASFHDATDDRYFIGRLGDISPYTYQRLTTRLPAGYMGNIRVSLSTYALDSALEISRDSFTRRLTRPFLFPTPLGRGPLLVRVRDKQGRVAGGLQLSPR